MLTYCRQALVQPAYKDNWFAKPALPNNLKWSQDTVTQQMLNNNISYPQQKPAWSKYPNGAYNPQYDDYISPPITDWDSSQPDPIWCPVAGGKGWGKPTGNCAGSSGTDTSGESATGSGPAEETNAQSVPVSVTKTTTPQNSPVQSTPSSSTTPGSVSVPTTTTLQSSPVQSTPSSSTTPGSVSVPTTTTLQSSPVQSTPPSSTTSGSIAPASSWNGTSSAQEQPAQKGIVADKQQQGVGGSIFDEQDEEDDTCEP